MAIKQLKSKEWLEQKYLKEQKSLQLIADELGCNKTTVQRALDRHNIPKRLRTSKYSKLNDKDWLVDAYVNQKRSLYDIAKEVGTSPGNVRDHLNTLGIKFRSIKEGIRLGADRKMENHPRWKGGKMKTSSGYIWKRAPEHPKANSSGYVQEHRLVAEEVLGRYLKSSEIVHHRDGNKANNDPSNLEIVDRSSHFKKHFEAVQHVNELRRRVAELEAENARIKAELERYKNPISASDLQRDKYAKRDEKIIEQYVSGENMEIIGYNFGLSRNRIWQIVQKWKRKQNDHCGNS